MNSKLIYIVGVAMMLCSCESVIEFSGEQTESKPVVFCDATQGAPLQVAISNSVFFLDNTSGTDCYFSKVKDKIRTVHATINGRSVNLNLVSEPVVDPYAYENRAYYSYQSSESVTCGSKITLDVDIDGFPHITGTTTVPDVPDFGIVSAQFVEDTDAVNDWGRDTYGDAYHRGYMLFTLRIKDDPGQSDYYQLKVYSNMYDGEYYYNMLYSTSDVMFFEYSGISDVLDIADGGNEEQNIYNGYFSDTAIQGTEHVFKIKVAVSYEGDSSGPGADWRIALKHLSKERYYYLTSLETISDSDDFGFFSEYASMYSNMDGAIGCISSSAEKVISLSK